VTIATAVAALCSLLDVPYAPLWSLLAAAIYSIGKLMGRLPTLYWRAAAGSALTAAVILALWRVGPSSGAALRSSVDRLSLRDVWAVPPQQRDSLELYNWARTQTGIDSLFFVYTEQDRDRAPLAFRYQAQRSITCSYKEISQASYTKYRMIELFDCYFDFRGALVEHDYGQLMALLAKYGVDYAVLPVAETQVGALAPPLEVVFENGTYRVFKASALRM
jgi:hypothetical protein